MLPLNLDDFDSDAKLGLIGGITLSPHSFQLSCLALLHITLTYLALHHPLYHLSSLGEFGGILEVYDAGCRA